MGLRDANVLVLFDGNCALCNRSVLFLLEHDRHGALRFAPLDSPLGRIVGDGPRASAGWPGSILVREGEEVLRESDAILRLAGLLGSPWSVLGATRVLPKALRDGLYRWIARHRLRWFGSTDGCALMRSEWKDRFVDVDSGFPSRSADSRRKSP